VANTIDAMRRARRLATVVGLGVMAGGLLASCGSGTKTVTVSSVPPAPQTTSAPKTTPSTTTSTPSATTPVPSTSAPSTTESKTTRSAPEPAFTKTTPQSEGLSAAAAAVRAQGFTPNDTSEYHEGQALRVLVGTRSGSSDGYGQQAFFFVNGRYIGTDSKLTSATVKVVSQGDTEVTLAYPLYRKSDPLSSPSGGEAHVTFQLNNGKLVPLGTIPPASSASGLSRQ
jgi:hypothetical protein